MRRYFDRDGKISFGLRCPYDCFGGARHRSDSNLFGQPLTIGRIDDDLHNRVARKRGFNGERDAHSFVDDPEGRCVDTDQFQIRQPGRGTYRDREDRYTQRSVARDDAHGWFATIPIAVRYQEYSEQAGRCIEGRVEGRCEIGAIAHIGWGKAADRNPCDRIDLAPSLFRG